jgi:hypothetical protein
MSAFHPYVLRFPSVSVRMNARFVPRYRGSPPSRSSNPAKVRSNTSIKRNPNSSDRNSEAAFEKITLQQGLRWGYGENEEDTVSGLKISRPRVGSWLTDRAVDYKLVPRC